MQHLFTIKVVQKLQKKSVKIPQSYSQIYTATIFTANSVYSVSSTALTLLTLAVYLISFAHHFFIL